MGKEAYKILFEKTRITRKSVLLQAVTPNR